MSFRVSLAIKGLHAAAEGQHYHVGELLMKAADRLREAQELRNQMRAARARELDEMGLGDFKALVLRLKLPLALPIGELKERILETEFPDLH